MLEIVSGMKNRNFFHVDEHHNLLGHALSLSLCVCVFPPLENYMSIYNLIIFLGMVAVEGGQGLGTIIHMFGGFTFKISSTKMYSCWFTMCSKVR